MMFGNLNRSAASDCRSGTAAVEFAIVCPLLMLMCLACSDFGRISHSYQVLANAVRTGAELGAAKKFTDFTRLAWEENVREAVLLELENLPGFNESNLDYTLTAIVDADEMVRVVIEVEYPFKTLISWPLLPSETNLYKRVEFRQFR